MSAEVPSHEESLRKGHLYFHLLLAGVTAVPLVLSLLMIILPPYSKGILQVSILYPIEIMALIAISATLGILVGRGRNLRYLWLITNMLQSISLAFFSIQLFQYSLGLGYLGIGGCIGVLAGGFYSFYQQDIQYYLRAKRGMK